MNAAAIVTIIAAGEATAEAIAKLIASLKAQSGLTDEQLLDEAAKIDQETRNKVDAFLARLK